MPKELKVSGKEEVLTVRVTYETLELYGKVEATRQIRVTASVP